MDGNGKSIVLRFCASVTNDLGFSDTDIESVRIDIRWTVIDTMWCCRLYVHSLVAQRCVNICIAYIRKDQRIGTISI